MAEQIRPFKLDRVAVEGITAPSDELKCPIQKQERETVTSKNNSSTQSSDVLLPRGLIGPKCTATVTIEGVQCVSLLDSGSQVTTISKSFHESHLSHRPIFPIQDLLDIEGAGGQEVPYLGYVQANIHFPEDVMGKAERVVTLALVVPDHRTNMDVPLLIGTNTLDPLYAKCAQNKFGKYSSRASHCFQLVKHLYQRYKIHQQNGRVGTVKLQSKKCITIPAGERVALTGYARHVPVAADVTLLVEPPQSNLPGGLFFCSYIMTSPSCPSFKVPVLVKNETARDITVPAGHIIAELSLTKAVSSLPSHDAKATSSEPSHPASASATCNAMNVSDSSKLTFDFADSPLSEEWKERITKKLNSASEAFAHSDLDYGHTTEIKH